MCVSLSLSIYIYTQYVYIYIYAYIYIYIIYDSGGTCPPFSSRPNCVPRARPVSLLRDGNHM